MDWKRARFTILKVIISAVVFFSLAIIIYLGINSMISSDTQVQEEYNDVINCTIIENTATRIYDADRTAVIVGTASVLMAVLTMLQQHMTRSQDRALAFPKMEITQCEFCMGTHMVNRNSFFYNTINGGLLIRVKFDDSFAACYVPEIYRLWIVRHPYGNGKKEYEPMKILNSFSSLGEGSLCIDTIVDNSEFIEKYIEKQQGIYDYMLEIVMDISWKNDLLMMGLRNMSKMYLRYEIRVDDMGRKKNGDFWNYLVKNVDMKGAPYNSKIGDK